MFNDVVGGVPVALAYCTLCGSGILFETQVAGRPEPFVFGSSGFLYRSNKLMYDRGTNSLWNQFLGSPVVGPLTGSGIVLKIRPVVITTWKDWRAAHPETKVLSLETGFARDYSPGRPYGAYFASPDLMFPALVPDGRLQPKDYVFALRTGDDEKAWPLSAFEGGTVINDRLGDIPVVLIGDAATRTVRAYRAGGRTFAAAAGGLREVVAGAETWRSRRRRWSARTGSGFLAFPATSRTGSRGAGSARPRRYSRGPKDEPSPRHGGGEAVPGIGCGGKLLRVTPKLGAARFLGRLPRLRRFRGGRPGATSRTDNDLLSQVIVFGRTLQTDVLRATV